MDHADQPVDQCGDRPVPGAEPPVGETPADHRHREHIAAGFHSIYETAHHGLRDMGAKRTLQTLLKINQKDGFDCPSCAWPDPDGKRNVAEFCENGAKAVASEAMTARATPEFFARHGVAELAAHDDYWLDQQGRITQPMVLRAGATHYQPMEWDAAFELIADHLNKLTSPDEAVFYTSGRTSNEAAFIYQLFVRQFGTNNLPDCSNMCHESTSVGLPKSIGLGKATITHADFEEADSIFIIGQNPGTCHPRMLTSLQAAVRKGCKIVSINPLMETGLKRFKHPQEPLRLLGTGTPMACLFLPVRINGDIAALKGIMKQMLEEDDRSGGKALDHDFIRQYTEGFETLAEDLRKESWDVIVDQSGLSRDKIAQAAQIAIGSQRMICCWAMGITQHKNGVGNVHTIANFALLRGQIGRRGAGLCPVRGHSNVQGDRTMGIWEKIKDQFRHALEVEFKFAPPTKEGYDAVHAITAMHAGKVGVLFCLGGNLLGAAPDTSFTAQAFVKCKLTVQVSTKINRSHLITGQCALILPCLGRTERDVQKSGEQFVSMENTTGVVHQSRGLLEPASEHLLSECAIIARLARATLKDRSLVGWEGLMENYDLIRGHIERVVPGCEQYNHRVRQPGGFYLPNPPREGKFPTPSGKAMFIVHPIPRHDLGPGQWLLTTIRSHDQFNTTIYGFEDRYRGVTKGRRVVFLNEQDMRESNLTDGQMVDLVSRYEGVERRAAQFRVMAYEIPRRCAAAYFPETNVLVPVQAVAEESNQPACKSIRIVIEPSSRHAAAGP